MTMTIEGRAWPMSKDDDHLELRYTSSGTAMCKFKVAQYGGKDSDGEPKPKVYWTVMAWGEIAERVAECIPPGSEVVVVGVAQANNWEDNEGRKRYDTEIRAYTVAASLRWDAVHVIRTDRQEGGPYPQPQAKPQARDAYGPDEAPF